MPYHLEYASDKGTVVVTTGSHLSDAEAQELTQQAAALLNRTHATRVLGDCRGMESGPSLAVIYWLVHDYASLGTNSRTRIALIQPQTPQANEIAQFYATVCANRQYQAELFPNQEAAEAWLSAPVPA